jgi:hypothetical protein
LAPGSLNILSANAGIRKPSDSLTAQAQMLSKKGVPGGSENCEEGEYDE